MSQPTSAQRFAAGVFRVPLVGTAVQRTWRGARSLAQRLGFQAAARRYLREHAVAKLQLGASFTGHPGWFNTDLFPERWPVMRMDAARRFPLPDAAFHFVFCEHMIEHVPLDGARTLLAESFRVLRPGGRIRIATPDLARIIGVYSAPADPVHQRYLERTLGTYALARDLPARVAAFNGMFYLHGHRFIHDEESLSLLLRGAGFVDVRRFAPGESDTPELRGIEIHHHAIGVEANNLESLVLEARKA